MGEVRGYRGLRIYQNTGTGRVTVKSAIVIFDDKLDITQYPELTTDNIVVIRIQTKAWTLNMVSLYFEPDKPIENYLTHLQRIHKKLGPINMLIAGDFNAKSPWWGSPTEDQRGEQVCGTLDGMGMHIINVGDTPTFDTIRGGKRYSSHVDITACTVGMLNLVSDWHLEEGLTSSDHNAIIFDINLKKSTGIKIKRTTRMYNTRKANWDQFHENLILAMQENKLTLQDIQQINSTHQIDNTLDIYTKIITQTCTNTIPYKKHTDTLTLPWWSQELADMKKQVATKKRRIKNAAPVRRNMVVGLYLKQKEEYLLAVKKAQEESWKDFCSKQDKEGVWEGIYRVIGRTTKREEDVPLIQNGITLSSEKSAMLLATTFYPEDREDDDSAEHRRIREMANIINEQNHAELHDPPFTITELYIAVESFNPKKAPGSDGFTADICTHAINADPEYFLALLNRCLMYHYFPTIWKKATVIVLKKPGKADYTIPKSYRPIGLLPVFGKIYEKLLIARLKFYVLPCINKNQYGFMPQKGTEDSLYTLIQYIKEKLKQRKLITVISLDIEGAFDSAWWPLIRLRLAEMKVPLNLRRTIDSYLSNRCVSVRYAGAEYKTKTTKGCIQGSIGGPIIWNALLNPLLDEIEKRGIYCQAFADDIVLVFDGEIAADIEEQANTALTHVLAWGNHSKLKFAPQKTCAMIITNKLKYDAPRLSMGGIDIEISQEIKILGLIIDNKLTFNKHVTTACKKAIGIYKQLARAARVSWGLHPEVVRTIYTAAVEPVLLYAASAWAPAAKKIDIKKQLNVVQRGFAQKICKAYRTVSLNSALVLAGLLPINLRINEVALLYEAKKGVAQVAIGDWEVEQMALKIKAPHPAERIKIEYNNIMDDEQYNKNKNFNMRIYTDGSKIEGKVGAAISIWENDAETKALKFALPSFCTVYQAELLALNRAVHEVYKCKYTNFGIYSDSTAALQTIKNIDSPHPLAVETRDILSKCRGQNKKVSIFWIKAHIGLEGNERADKLAKDAAQKLKVKPYYEKCPISFVKRMYRLRTLDEWNRTYQNSNTGNTTKVFFPNVITAYSIIKKINTDQKLTQLFTGHGGFSSYLYRFKCKDNPACICDLETEESVIHLLVDCPIHTYDRIKLEHMTGIKMKVDNIHKYLISDYREEFLKYGIKIVNIVNKRNK